MLNNFEFSPNGVSKLESLESFKATIYRDAAGIPTIGFGHKVRLGDGILMGDSISSIEGTALLLKDAAAAVHAVNFCVETQLNQNQFDALVIFVYNIGVTAFQNSRLLQLLNAGDFASAANELLVWDKAHVQGQLVELAGLRNRREAEQELFLTPVGVSVPEEVPSNDGPTV